jgi:DNA-binding beta-propeller fold protein YncE
MDMEKQKTPLAPKKKWLRLLGISLTSMAVVLVLIVFGLPLALSLRPAPKTVHLLQIIDLPGLSVVGFADYLTLSGQSLYVGYTSQNQLVTIDTQTSKVVTSIKGLAGVHGFAVDPSLNLGFTSDGKENKVGITDLSTNRLLAKVPGGIDPDAIIFDDKDQLIYAADHAGKTATLIDPVTRKIVTTIPLGGTAEFVEADPITGYVYQNLEDTNETVVVDPKRRAVIARYKTAPGDGPTGLALDTYNKRVFVVCGNNTLVVLDEKGGHRIASLPIGSGVDGVGYDPGLKRIYTANGLGTMTVVQQDTVDQYHVLENVPTPFGGHTLAVDPVTHRVYVGCAGFGSAKIAVYAPTL